MDNITDAQLWGMAMEIGHWIVVLLKCLCGLTIVLAVRNFLEIWKDETADL